MDLGEYILSIVIIGLFLYKLDGYECQGSLFNLNTFSVVNTGVYKKNSVTINTIQPLVITIGTDFHRLS